MSAVNAGRAVQTRQRAWEDAWIVQQRYVVGLSPMAIAALTGLAVMTLADGSYGLDGGLGHPLAERTVRWRLQEERQAYADEYIGRPIVDAVMEAERELEHVKAMHMAEARAMSGTDRVAALNAWLRAEESRRKLIGLDQPTRVQVDDVRTTNPVAAEVTDEIAAAVAQIRAEQQQMG